MRILLVEDSERVAQSTSAALRAHGHFVAIAPDLRSATDLFDSSNVDLAIVDIGLPDGSGVDWCRTARASGSTIPIIILTARSSVPDRVAGLDAGADDYLGKPFAVDELLARVRALGRRGPRWDEARRWYGALSIDRERRSVAVDEAAIALTPREFDIVALLAWRDGRVVGRDDLLDCVWGNASASAAASCDVLLARVRRKLGDRGIEDAIRTVRQIGYAWALKPSKLA